MLSKLFLLIAVILFVVAALDGHFKHIIEWGLASGFLGLLLEGYGPADWRR